MKKNKENIFIAVTETCFNQNNASLAECFLPNFMLCILDTFLND